MMGNKSLAKKVSGVTGLLKYTSSLPYRKCSESPGILCRWCSIITELKQGKHSAGRISVWSTIWIFGCVVSSHSGTWLSVTIKIFRIHGAYFSNERKLYFNSSLLSYRPLQFFSSFDGSPIQALRFAIHLGSLPSTQRYTKSMSTIYLKLEVYSFIYFGVMLYYRI